MGDEWIPSAKFIDIGVMADSDIVLDVTALGFSSLDHPHRSPRSAYMLLDHMACDVRSMLRPHLSSDQQARVLACVLGRTGFECVKEPLERCSDVLRALETRRATPMMLAIVYVGAARRSGLDAAIMDVVTGVVIRLGSDRDHVFVGVGPNAGFEVLDARSDRTAYVVSPYPPLSNRMTLVMLMDEEAIAAERRGDLDRASALYDRICAVAPGHHQLWWKKASIETRMARYRAARMSLMSILELTRNQNIRQSAQDALASLACH
jgi:tetratricopeptide (TPR) repeat protein